MRTKRIERLLNLIQMLQSERPCSASDLARSAGVSKRTVFRDLELLSRAGIRYDFDRITRRYSTQRQTLLPPVSLTHAEALALMMVTRHALDHPLMPDVAVAASAGLKIESMLPQAIRDYCGPVLDYVKVRYDPASRSEAVRDTLPLVQLAMVRRNKIRIHYDSYYEGRGIDAVIHPYRLAYIHRGWYVLAYTEEEGEVRTYKLERILRFALCEETYRMDPHFSLERYMGNAWLMIRGEKRYRVVIRFRKKVAANVDEIVWHKTQQTRFEEDGSLRFEVEVDGLNEISWWVLGYGDQAEVLKPQALRDMIAAHAAHMIACYHSGEES